MIRKLKDLNRYNISLLLFGMTIFSFGLSITRYIITGTKIFMFLNWNLFLAFLPWLISSIVVLKGFNSRAWMIFLICSWLLFFPNSPYILTDLFHLRMLSSAPIWYDLIVILSFAWTGLLYGFISLMDIEKMLENYFNDKLIAFMTIVFLFLSAFGIYLGRFLRWNSWDIIGNPLGLMFDIVDRFVNPFSHPRTWGLTILMGILLNMMYFSFKLIKTKN